MNIKALGFCAGGVESGHAALASEDALDATAVSASIPLNSGDVLALTVIHSNQSYAALVRVLENLSRG